MYVCTIGSCQTVIFYEGAVCCDDKILSSRYKGWAIKVQLPKVLSTMLQTPHQCYKCKVYTCLERCLTLMSNVNNVQLTQLRGLRLQIGSANSQYVRYTCTRVNLCSQYLLTSALFRINSLLTKADFVLWKSRKGGSSNYS